MALTEQYTVTWNEKFSKRRSVTGQSSIAVSESFAPGKPFQLIELRIQSDGAVNTSEEFTLTLDSGAGADWDQEIYGKDLSEAGSIPWQFLFDQNRSYGPNDAIDIAYANTDTNKISFELIFRLSMKDN